jgi:ferric-dicitrate binding protein FerR (iron transport regulator)
MNMTDTNDGHDRDEAGIAALLKRVGARPRPADGIERQTRLAVEAEWRDIVAARRRRNTQARWYAAAASVAVVAVGAWFAWPATQTAPVAVATLGPVVGEVELREGAGPWHTAGAGATVNSNSTLRTGRGGLAALALASGVQVRLDSGTVLAMNDPGTAQLESGAVYVDAGGHGRAADGFVVETPAGAVRHLGTQYVARLDGRTLEIAVREGRVEVRDDGRAYTADAGEQLTVSDASVTRSRVSPSAPQWDWIGGVTPPYSIEGRTVSQFLAWAGRETGRSVVYATPADAALAERVTLSGTVAGLPPRQAVDAVLATTSLGARYTSGSIEVTAAR